MNSRDAAYDEMEMMALLADSAAEAATGVAVQSSPSPVNGSVNGLADIEEQAPSPITAKKKRKRGSEDAFVTLDLTLLPSLNSLLSVATPKSISMPAPPVPPAKSSGSRNRRGGGGRSRPSAQTQDAASVDGDEGGVPPGPSNRRSGGGRSRAGGSRRNPNGEAVRRPNGSGGGSGSAPPTSFSRTFSSSQQQQQPLLTSWGLPDYLAHLEPTLPSKIPQPLQLRGSCEERGVRVRWPGKRMSVGDMNKRVRALVEWVGREQASASERYRRREALKAALGDTTSLGALPLGDAGDTAVDGAPLSHRPRPPPPPSMTDEKGTEGDIANLGKSTMKMMEELMEELIGFQERFGPGAKSRERRTAVLS